MPWSQHPNITAILTNFLGGQQSGNAIADVLFGDLNPSARLPLTMPNKENEIHFSTEQWPGLPDPAKPMYAMYSEQLLVGYRYYDAKGIEFSTGFPFGHGLSYTSFAYTNLVITSSNSEEGASTYHVSFELKNTGDVAGAEIVQLYLGFPAISGEPPSQLKGFEKVVLEAGAKTAVQLELTQREVSVWDVISHRFAVAEGTFQVHVCASSRDIRLSGSLEVL